MELAQKLREMSVPTGYRYRKPKHDTGYGDASLNLSGPMLLWWKGDLPPRQMRLVVEYRQWIRVRILPAERSWVEMMDARKRLETRAGREKLRAANISLEAYGHRPDGSGLWILYSRHDDTRPTPTREAVVQTAQRIARVPVVEANPGGVVPV